MLLLWYVPNVVLNLSLLGESLWNWENSAISVVRTELCTTVIVLCKIITLWNWENSAISVVYMPAVIRMRYYCCCVLPLYIIIIIIEELLEVLSLLAIHLLLFKYGLIETHISSSEIVLTSIYKIILQYNIFYTPS